MDSFLNAHANQSMLSASGQFFSLPNASTLNQLSSNICNIDLISQFGKKEQNQMEASDVINISTFQNAGYFPCSTGGKLWKEILEFPGLNSNFLIDSLKDKVDEILNCNEATDENSTALSRINLQVNLEKKQFLVFH